MWNFYGIQVLSRRRVRKYMYGMIELLHFQGCLEGEEREKWWNEMKEILSITEQELKEREQWNSKKDDPEQSS